MWAQIVQVPVKFPFELSDLTMRFKKSEMPPSLPFGPDQILGLLIFNILLPDLIQHALVKLVSQNLEEIALIDKLFMILLNLDNELPRRALQVDDLMDTAEAPVIQLVQEHVSVFENGVAFFWLLHLVGAGSKADL